MLTQDALAEAWSVSTSTAVEKGREDGNRGACELLVGFSFPQCTEKLKPLTAESAEPGMSLWCKS